MIGHIWTTLIAVVAGFVLLWFALLIALAVTRPADLRVTEILRLLPDTVVLLRRLAADPDLPRGVRVRLLLLLVYLALPVDLIPDFIPVLGYADDAIVVALALRSQDRPSAGEQVQRRGGLRGDSRVASTGVCHGHAEAQAAESVAGGDVPEHGPRLHVGVECWDELRCAAILLLPQRSWEQLVEVVNNPKRVDAGWRPHPGSWLG